MSSDEADEGYSGLTDYTEGLRREVYFDAGHHQRELERIWYRNWIYVGRSSVVDVPRSFSTFEIGDQRVLLVRARDGRLRGFHNTCRHRGAALCRDESGCFETDAIVCPYHAWAYDLEGRLRHTTSKRLPRGFHMDEIGLYSVAVREWRGCMFVALNDDPPSFESSFDVPISRLNAWPLERLSVGHVMLREMKCNWKIFWENYNECLHCPGVHPSLSRLVPLYGRGLLEERDDPRWREHLSDTSPKFKGGLRDGARTWSMDGAVSAAAFPDISEQDSRLGHVYMTGLPGMFMVGHADYVRVVRVRPLGPELTELRIEYLFAPDVLSDPKFDLRNVIEFANGVMAEDAEVCELNQRGLKARPHARGILMPEEYVLRQFHEWIAGELTRA